MSISLYDISVVTYLQTLGGIAGVLEKGAAYASDQNLDPAEIVETRLRPDMQPFRFQVISVAHHSRGAIEGMRSGLFQPPPAMPELDYAGLQELVTDATGALQAVAREEIEALEGNRMMFRAGKFELPFTAENFIISFSLPNFFFHATTTYDILRMVGVPLGKLDFLGQMRVSA